MTAMNPVIVAKVTRLVIVVKAICQKSTKREVESLQIQFLTSWNHSRRLQNGRKALILRLIQMGRNFQKMKYLS